jgi:hypothetical protein
MHTIKVIWRGGPNWDPNEDSMVDSSKKKSAIEHLIQTGGQTIDEAIDTFSYFRPMPIKVEQQKGAPDSDINWLTILEITETDSDAADKIKDDLLRYYAQRQNDLAKTDTNYTIEIITNQ